MLEGAFFKMYKYSSCTIISSNQSYNFYILNSNSMDFVFNYFEIIRKTSLYPILLFQSNPAFVHV